MMRQALSLRPWSHVGAFLAIVATVLILGACGESTHEIVILGEDAANLQAIEQVVPSFTEETGIPVRVVRQPFDVAQAQATQDLANGTGLYDVILQYNTELSPFTRKGWVLTLEDMAPYLPENRNYEKDIFQHVWKEVGHYPAKPDSDQLVAVGYPFSANTMILVYNRELINDPVIATRYEEITGETVGPPETWDEYRALAEAATNPAQGTSGVVLQGAAGWLYYEWTNFAFGMGGGIMKKEFGWQAGPEIPLIIHSPETVAATEFYLSLKPYTAGDFFSTGQTEQQTIMREGNTAMAIMWSDIAVPLSEGPNAEKFGFAPIPGEVSMTAGGSFFVNRATQNRQEVGQLLGYLMRGDVQARMLSLGLSSPSRAAYEAPETQGLPFVPALKHSLERGVYMLEAGPDAVAIQQIMEKHLQRAWRGDTEVPQALENAQEEVRETQAEIFAGLDGG